MAKQIAKMSVEEMGKKYKVKTKDGTVSTVGGKYYLTVEGKKRELKPERLILPLPLKRLTGKTNEVRVVFSPEENLPIIFYFKKPPGGMVMCYFVATEEHEQVAINIRIELIKKLAKDKKLPATLAEQLISDIVAEAKK
jgi:hypothetical protein